MSLKIKDGEKIGIKNDDGRDDKDTQKKTEIPSSEYYYSCLKKREVE